MESQEFIVLYTHQKMKKSKVWQDGILKISHLGNKAILYDDKGGCLESLFLKCLEVKPGDDLESDRYLITVEEVKVAGSTAVKQDVIKEAPVLNSKRCMSSGRSLGCQLAGLKRKFTGFQGPRQVPKKTVITENSEPAASLESEKPGPVFLSPLYNTPPLFSTVGKKDTSNMPTDSENIVTYKNRERNGIPFSSVISTPSFKINPEVLCEENYACCPISSVNKHSDSLLTDESMKRDSLVSHGLGVSQNIRSKAQILALLKSTSTSTSKELNSEIIGHFPQIQPQGSLAIPTEPNCLIEQEEYVEVTSTESLHNQHQSENAMRNKSRWAMYLSSQSSPVDSSTVDGKNAEEKPKTQEGNLNLKDLSMQKRIQFFETCAEKGKRYNEDKLIDDNDQSWDQEGKLEISSFYENSSLPINCSIVVNDGLLLDSDIQKSNKRSVDQNDQIGIKGSILIREKAQEININGTPEKKYEHLQIESSLSNNSGISDDSTNIFSKSSTNNESLSSIHEPMSDISQPLVEVTFNLNNFETSDTEEESQESSRISQDSEDWVKETSVNSSNSRCENISCKEVSSEHLPLSTSIGDTLSETFPTKEILPSQFCDKTCVGYDTETWKAGNTGKEIKEVCSDTLSNFDSSLEWTDDRHVENDEGANKSISASFPSKSESMNTNLNIPHFLNIATDQKPENNPFSEQAQTRPLILGSDLDKNTNQVLPLTSSSGNSIQLLNAKQIHSKECIALDKSQTQASNSLCYPLGKTHISRDTESHISESEEVGRSQSLFQDHIDVETSGESKQYWNNLRNSSEISGLVNSISLLKSLAEHSTALEGLEVLKKKNTSFKQQGTLQTYESDSNPEARKPLTTIVSQATPKSPHLNQDPHQMIKENKVEPSESLQSLQFFPLGSEEETAFLAVIPKQMERETCKDPKPVEFQGHQVKGSATSAVMVRGHSSQVGCSQFLDSTAYESCTTNTCVLTPELPSTCMQIDFLQFPNEENFPKGDTSFTIEDNFQVIAEFNKDLIKNDSILDFPPKDSDHLHNYLDYNFKSTERTSWEKNKVTSPEQKISTLSPVSTLCFNSRDDDFMLEFSEESLKAQTLPVMKKSSSLENKNLQRLSFQEVNDSELCFPSGQKVKSACLPQRQIHIPAVFQSPAHYKQIFTSCLTEHLNILLFGLAQRLHKALSKVDISFYTSSNGDKLKNVENNVPSCHHQQPAKLVMVKKEGPNKGRLFYTCDGPKADQCKFFKWFEEMTPGYLTQEKSLPSMVLSDIKSIGLYLRSQKIPLYEECQLFVRKGFDFQRKRYGKLKKFTTVDPEFYNEPKSKLYLKLSRKESSSTYSKDDLWVVSKTLDFELDTFIACSTFFGPSSVNEVELLPLKGYSPSNWPANTVVHALLVCNASTELTSLRNIRDYFNPATLPLTQYLITMSSSTTTSNKRVNKRKFIPPAFSNINTKFELLSIEATLKLASELIQAHKLNEDQAAALIQIAQMMASRRSVEEAKELAIHTLPITIIHGVFGAGKSYLLAVVILFFVQLFEKCEALRVGNARPWKLLISSSTNVAVDRVLLGLLSLGFEKFVRVGSVRKIAKPVLPYSLYAGSENENEQLKELHALMKEDLTPMERVYVRKSIEQHKLGTNKTLLKQVPVVGVTCAACPFPCMNDLKFPVVVLDECSQMTEPASLLPIARFECEKLILVGDPKQLPPTIQGSDAAHENGLEQTLFDRLCLMGHKPILLRTQYRCHPTISAIANDLFYEGHLVNGISATERSPLLEWLPTLCFYDVKGLEQIERGNSFHNVAEAAFTLKLIQSLVASGIAGAMIGVITLYKSQMHKLCHLLSAVDFDHPDMKAVQVSTVDAFQGAEKEIIILSCVRTRQVGFIDSEKRMNVALTRGRRHLLIVGNLACLRKNRLWGHVIQHCEGREGGLQHASQYEPQLDHLLKDYLEKQAEEKQKKKAKKDKLTDKKSYSQKDMV
ncbi:protein ZGRF1 isoform X1 [Cervus elaphus]|uniref:protein ZGRF1 isoform X1 n=1 Tax=Cervus elaphus TaxID=9860 RepID=UPI001CC2AACD|nr:protein ZGRF1 isoform X1 [Cervus elaphus]XP_043726807.1 protein ZGRF1 isoform X1 [Cervus elaphus]XP_043726808.1 protein ZGRF1 isoform X1 [Cervus elaphus]XP_043726810.1 protein ZGRF1 isoform X1 [Cervus elaphus]